MYRDKRDLEREREREREMKTEKTKEREGENGGERTREKERQIITMASCFRARAGHEEREIVKNAVCLSQESELGGKAYGEDQNGRRRGQFNHQKCACHMQKCACQHRAPFS